MWATGRFRAPFTSGRRGALAGKRSEARASRPVLSIRSLRTRPGCSPASGNPPRRVALSQVRKLRLHRSSRRSRCQAGSAPTPSPSGSPPRRLPAPRLRSRSASSGALVPAPQPSARVSSSRWLGAPGATSYVRLSARLVGADRAGRTRPSPHAGQPAGRSAARLPRRGPGRRDGPSNAEDPQDWHPRGLHHSDDADVSWLHFLVCPALPRLVQRLAYVSRSRRSCSAHPSTSSTALRSSTHHAPRPPARAPQGPSPLYLFLAVNRWTAIMVRSALGSRTG
jgi:hypothetical protein